MKMKNSSLRLTQAAMIAADIGKFAADGHHFNQSPQSFIQSKH